MSDTAPQTKPSALGGKKGSSGKKGSKQSKGLTEWLQTKEGKIVAGGAAVLIVVVLGLRRAQASGEGDDTFSAEAIQRDRDLTLQDRLDQVGYRGGTLEEWIEATGDLSHDVRGLTEVLESQDPETGTNRTNIGGVPGLKEQDLVQHPKVPLETFRRIQERPDDFKRLIANPDAARKFRIYDLRKELRRKGYRGKV